MNVDLAPYEIQVLMDLLKKERNRSFLPSLHEGHVPAGMKTKADIKADIVSYCKNRWCPTGQVNLLIEKLQVAQDDINRRFAELNL